MVADSIRDAIKNYSGIIPSRLASNRHFIFYTDRMNDYLGRLEKENSSWGDAYPYRYWLSLREGRLLGHFELGGHNLDDNTSEKQQLITNVLKPGDNRGDAFRYKRLYKTKLYRIGDTDEDTDIKKKVNTIIKELLSMENELFDRLG